MTISRGRLLALIVTLFISMTVFLGYNGYQYIFNDLNNRDKEAIISEVDDFTQSIINDIDQKENISAPPVVEPPAETAGINPPLPPQPDTVEQPPQPDLPKIEATKAGYQSGLLALQQEANAMVDRLIAAVKADYTALQASGADKSAYVTLAVDTMQKANVMETEVDAGFNLILSNMKAELEAENMPEADLMAYEEELRSIYKDQKNQRKDAIMDKAKEYL